MLFVHDIRQFIAELQLNKPLPEFDNHFIIKLSQYIHQLDLKKKLNATDLSYIEAIFSNRWDRIVDTQYDYTFNSAEPNAAWIKLSKKLALEINKTFLQLLVPVATNTIDPLSLQPLTDCSDLKGFYLAADGKNLRRVRPLFLHLTSGKPFSSYLSDKPTLRSALAMNELLRIRSKVGVLSFDYQSKNYTGFWNYLIREAIPKWHKKGQRSMPLLIALAELLTVYFIKVEPPEQNMSESLVHYFDKVAFQKKLAQLSAVIQRADINDANWFYGQSFIVKTSKIYLVEILLDALQLNYSTLYDSMLAVATWLSVLDPTLKINYPIVKNKTDYEGAISIPTVLAVKALVDGSLFPEGLFPSSEYDKLQMSSSVLAYKKFGDYYRQLSVQERARLDTQKIEYRNGGSITFGEAIHQVECGVCIAVQGEIFAQMVMDYAPYLRFSQKVESDLAIDSMRANSRKKVYAEYANSSSTAMLNDLLVVAASLMTYPFQTSTWGNAPVSFLDCSAMLPSQPKKIWDLIFSMFESKSFHNAPYYFGAMMVSIIEPALTNGSIGSWLFGSHTHQWLRDIKNGSLFKTNSHWSTRLLLKKLSDFCLADDIVSDSLLLFVDEVLRTIIQLNDPVQMDLRVNILFIKYMQTLPLEKQSLINKHLYAESETITDDAFYATCEQWIIHRLASTAPISRPVIDDKFFASHQPKHFSYRFVADALIKMLHGIDGSFYNRLEWLTTHIDALNSYGPSVLQTMTDYLNRLKQPIHHPLSTVLSCQRRSQDAIFCF